MDGNEFLREFWDWMRVEAETMTVLKHTGVCFLSVCVCVCLCLFVSVCVCECEAL